MWEMWEHHHLGARHPLLSISLNQFTESASKKKLLTLNESNRLLCVKLLVCTMGPKKAAAAKKKGGDGGGEAGGELTPEEKAKMFMLTCQALQVQLAERSEEASKALAAKREYQGRIEQISKDFEEEQRMTFEITQDMTRQYKGMQEELLTRINKLEDTIQDLNDRLAESDIRQEKAMKEKNAIIAMKDEEIAHLNMKMDDMAEEFGEMLRETLEKMRERIEISSNNYDGSDVLIQQRMEELKHND